MYRVLKIMHILNFLDTFSVGVTLIFNKYRHVLSLLETMDQGATRRSIIASQMDPMLQILLRFNLISLTSLINFSKFILLLINRV